VSTTNVQEPNEAGQGRTLLAWHFARDDSRQDFGEHMVIEPGGTERIDERDGLGLCQWGLHASVRAIDALGYGKGLNVRRVELRGQIVEGDDKACATERRELWRVDGRRPLLEWAIGCVRTYIDGLGADAAQLGTSTHRLLAKVEEFLAGDCDEAAVLRMLPDEAAVLRMLPDAAGSAVSAVHLARAAADGDTFFMLNAAFGAANALCNAAANAAGSDFTYSQTEVACNAELERRLLALAPEATR
jgi:hypothetical protein